MIDIFTYFIIFYIFYSDINHFRKTDKGQLELNGADNPGIVHKISSLLANYQLNINILTTSDEDAPFGGTKLFVMKCDVTAHEPVAQNFDPDVVRRALRELGDSLNCDIDLEDIN